MSSLSALRGLLCQNNVDEKISINWKVCSELSTLVGTCGNRVLVTQMKNDDEISVNHCDHQSVVLLSIFSSAEVDLASGDPWAHPSEMSEVIIVNPGAVFIISKPATVLSCSELLTGSSPSWPPLTPPDPPPPQNMSPLDQEVAFKIIHGHFCPCLVAA